MPPVSESGSDRERRLKCEAYLKIREERIAERKAAERLPLKEIQNIVCSLVYPTASKRQPTQNSRGVDDRSDSEYEPYAEEEAHFAEETLREEEEAALAMSKSMNAMEKKRETQLEGDRPLSDTTIVAEVLKEKSTNSTSFTIWGMHQDLGGLGDLHHHHKSEI